jgi:hypothetical protein
VASLLGFLGSYRVWLLASQRLGVVVDVFLFSDALAWFLWLLLTRWANLCCYSRLTPCLLPSFQASLIVCEKRCVGKSYNCNTIICNGTDLSRRIILLATIFINFPIRIQRPAIHLRGPMYPRRLVWMPCRCFRLWTNVRNNITVAMHYFSTWLVHLGEELYRFMFALASQSGSSAPSQWNRYIYVDPCIGGDFDGIP